MTRAHTSPDKTPHFADLLNHLFATRVSPRGKPYTLKEVCEGTEGFFSIAYLSLLRRGGIERPSIDRIRRLADFFGVEPSYFLGKEHQEDRQAAQDMDEALRHAFNDPQIRAFAMRVNDYSIEERTMVLAMLDQVHKLVESRRVRTHSTSGERGVAPDEDEDIGRE